MEPINIEFITNSHVVVNYSGKPMSEKKNMAKEFYSLVALMLYSDYSQINKTHDQINNKGMDGV